MHNILCTIGEFPAEAKRILTPLGKMTRRKADADIAIVGIGTLVDKKFLISLPKLKWIATPATGTDHIDLMEAKKRGIMVISLKGETTFLKTITPTAELALGLMIALIRKVLPAHADVIRGNWNRNAFAGHTLAGKTLGIVGYGRLGSMMAAYGKGLGMKVIFTDPNVKGGVNLAALLKTSDVVSLHVHLSESTMHMIGKNEIAKMKTGAILLNTARGAIVDEKSVIAALRKKKLGGYGADVLEGETAFGRKAKSPLIAYAKAHKNVILTPHIGGNTVEAREATDIFIAKKLLAALRKGTKPL